MDEIKLAKRLFFAYFIGAIVLILLWFVVHSALPSIVGKLLIAYIICVPLLLNGILGLTLQVTVGYEPFYKLVKGPAPFRSWVSLICGIVLILIIFVF